MSSTGSKEVLFPIFSIDKMACKNKIRFFFKTFLKCKPFAVLLSPSNGSTVRRSNRTSNSRRNAKQEEPFSGERSMGKRKSQNSVNCATDDDEVVVKKKKTRSRNRIQSSDDEDDDSVTPKIKSQKIKKRRRRNSVQSGGEDVVQPKKKTPVKRRKPLLTIKCNKITQYFEKATKTTRNEGKIKNVYDFFLTFLLIFLLSISFAEEIPNVTEHRSVPLTRKC